MADPLRVAILGCGPRGRAAGLAYRAHPQAAVVALCDLDAGRLAALGDELGVAARYSDLDRMMRQEQPELVVIPTATDLHYELAMRVLDHGANIDLEKPMGVDLEQADGICALAARRGLRVAVHHQTRFGPAMTAVARAIDEGKVGAPVFILGSGKGYYGGYGLMNIGTHVLCNMLKLAGWCRSVSAVGSTGGAPVSPHDVLSAPGGMGAICGERLTAALQFNRGVSATLCQHRLPRVDSNAYGLTVYGTEGRLIWRQNAWRLPTPHFVPDGQRDRWEPLPLLTPPGFDPALGANIDDYAYAHEYVRALQENRDHECSGQEARHTLEIMMGVFESVARGRRVDLPQPERDHPLLRWRAEHGLPGPPPAPRDYSAWLAEEDARLAARGRAE